MVQNGAFLKNLSKKDSAVCRLVLLLCLIPARLWSCRGATVLSLKWSKQVKLRVKSAENSYDCLKHFIMRWAANNNNKKICSCLERPVKGILRWKAKLLSIKYSPPVGLQKLPPLRRTAAVVSWVHSSHNGFQWRPTVMAKNVWKHRNVRRKRNSTTSPTEYAFSLSDTFLEET